MTNDYATHNILSSIEKFQLFTFETQEMSKTVNNLDLYDKLYVALAILLYKFTFIYNYLHLHKI